MSRSSLTHIPSDLGNSIKHLTTRQTNLQRAHDPIYLNLAIIRQILVKIARKHSVTHISPVVVIQMAFATQQHIKNFLSSISNEAHSRLEREEALRRSNSNLAKVDDSTIRNTNFELKRVLDEISQEKEQWKAKRLHLEKKRKMMVLKDLRRYHSEPEYSSESPSEAESLPDLSIDQVSDSLSDPQLYPNPINASPGQITEVQMKPPSQTPNLNPQSLSPTKIPDLDPFDVSSGKITPGAYAQSFEKFVLPKLDPSYQALSSPLLIRLYTLSKRWYEPTSTAPDWVQPTIDRLVFLLDQIYIRLQKATETIQHAKILSQITLVPSDSRPIIPTLTNQIPISTLFPSQTAQHGYPGLFDNSIKAKIINMKKKTSKTYIQQADPNLSSVQKIQEMSNKKAKYTEYLARFQTTPILLDDIIAILEKIPVYSRSNLLDKIIITRNIQKTPQ